MLDTANRLLHDGKLDSERRRVCRRLAHNTNDCGSALPVNASEGEAADASSTTVLRKHK
jgi:hypothetical protein